MEFAVGQPGAVRQDEPWSLQSPRFDDFHAARIQADRQQTYAVGITEGDPHLLAPHQAATRIGIALSEGEARDPAVFNPQIGRDDDAPLFFDPRAAPRGEVLRRAAVEHVDEFGPRGVGVLMPSQVLPQPVAERVGAKEKLELPHHDWRLLIDDGAVERSASLRLAAAAGSRSCRPVRSTA
jgi:hypothetical protein